MGVVLGGGIVVVVVVVGIRALGVDDECSVEGGGGSCCSLQQIHPCSTNQCLNWPVFLNPFWRRPSAASQ